MRTWKRAPTLTLCGFCGERIERDEPMLEIILKNTLMKDGEPVAAIAVKTPRVRCHKCAGEPVPPLPEPVKMVIAPQPKPAPSFASTAKLAYDWRSRQVGDEAEAS